MLLWFWWQLDPPGSPGETVEVRVDDGWSVSRIGDELVDRDVIGSSLVFNVYTRLSGKTDFQAGTYDLQRDMGVRDAVSTLESGPRIDYVELTVPPGLWLREIADRVGRVARPERAGLPREHPERLRSVRNTSRPARRRSKVCCGPTRTASPTPRTRSTSSATWSPSSTQHADALGLETATTEGRTPYEILTIASLIEAEAKVDEDRPLIASVIYNRLRDGMPLQIDASVLYASGDPEKQTITVEDLAFDSPYNTYVHGGLPPTPIGSVTEASLRAAMAPAQTEFPVLRRWRRRRSPRVRGNR